MGKALTWNRVLYVLALPPFVFSILLAVFYLHAGIILGHLPHSSLDDPKGFEVYSFYQPVIIVSGSVAFISIPVSFVYVLGSVVFFRKEVDWKVVFVVFCINVLMMGLLLSEIMEWFCD